MTRTLPALSLITIVLAALLAALPVYADRDRNPSCRIKAVPNTVASYGGSVTLSWDSNDADRAYISDVGAVAPDGSMRVPVNTSKTIRMTVHNGSRSAQCDTFVNILGERASNGPHYGQPYNTYAQIPYVHLTQIPYTGFDFGPLGNAIYWMSLFAVAVGGAYLLIYQSGMRALATVPVLDEILRAGRMQARAVRSIARDAYVQSQTPVHIEAETVEPAPVAAPARGDSMKVIEGEIPRIVITRD